MLSNPKASAEQSSSSSEHHPAAPSATTAAMIRLRPQTFPRPPLLERAGRHVRIVYGSTVVADTNDALWVLETWHPPSKIPRFIPFYFAAFFSDA
jgi:hypothetical protein